MASHHFVGKGRVSKELTRTIVEPSDLISRVTGLVRRAELEVVEHRVVDFEGGGLTLVWVLAESHLVLHYWPEQGFATIDLHVCDYRESNRSRAATLIESLTELCFVPGSVGWQELHLEDPAAALSPTA